MASDHLLARRLPSSLGLWVGLRQGDYRLLLLVVRIDTTLMVSRSSSSFVVFWLVLCIGLNIANAVCEQCGGYVPGCAGPGDQCILLSGVTDNASALLGTATTAVVVSKLLPNRLIRLLPRAVLDSIKSMVKSPAGTFDCSGKSMEEVFDAALHGHVSTDEALIWCQKEMMRTATKDAALINKIKSTMDTIKHLDVGGGSGSTASDGALLYVWALTDRCARDGDTVVLKSFDEGVPKSSNPGALKLVRPSTMAEFTRRLNLWVMILHATGVVNILITSKFLDEVVYAAFVGGKDWKVVHELFVVYLRAVEDGVGVTLANVYASGGMDVKMKEAEANASTYFRGQRGEPAPSGGAAKKWNCASDGTINRPCISYNLKQDHPASAIDPATGRCKYKHVCDAFVKGADGKRTQCGSADHGRKDCTHPDKEARA